MTEHSVEIQRLEGETSAITMLSKDMVIASQGDMEETTDRVRDIKALMKKVKATFDPMVETAYISHKTAVAGRNGHLEPLQAAERTIKGKMGAYQDECEKKRQEEEEAARQKALKEQERMLKAAKKRIEKLNAEGGDIREKMTRIEKEMEDPEITDIQEAAFMAELEVLKAQEEGNAEKVAEKAAAAVAPTYTPPTAPSAPRPKVKGLSSSVKKVGTVTDPVALIKAVAAGTIPEKVIKFDLTAINKLLNAGIYLSGVTYENDRTMTVR